MDRSVVFNYIIQRSRVSRETHRRSYLKILIACNIARTVIHAGGIGK